MNRLVLSCAALASLLVVTSCDNDRKATKENPEASKHTALTKVVKADDSAVQFQKGDWVKLRYTGSFTADPVEIVQRILRIEEANDKKKVTMGIHMKRGSEEKRFLQITDGSYESRRSGLPDEVIEIDAEGKETKLKMLKEQDLIRLWKWTLPSGIGGKPRNMKSNKVAVVIGQQTFQCNEERGESDLDKKVVHLAFRQCKDFVWFKAPSEVKVADGSVIWQADVVAFGSAADFPKEAPVAPKAEATPEK
ncbi:MAG: hypothetical protein GY822_09900 [Deltaproteobacteria bacterium]|nr:hypothetical protein [Deltaproteobacteria bacterium]